MYAFSERLIVLYIHLLKTYFVMMVAERSNAPPQSFCGFCPPHWLLESSTVSFRDTRLASTVDFSHLVQCERAQKCTFAIPDSRPQWIFSTACSASEHKTLPSQYETHVHGGFFPPRVARASGQFDNVCSTHNSTVDFVHLTGC